MASRVHCARHLSLLVILLGIFLTNGQGYAAALRAASLNLCTDQLLLGLAPASDIVGISPLARDCAESPLCEAARQVPVMRPDGESLWSSRPTVVLDGLWGRPLAARLARRLNITLHLLPPAKRLDDIPAQINQVAAWTGHEKAGREQAAAFAEQRTSIHPLLTDHPPTAALWGESTNPLLEDALHQAGFTVITPPGGITEEYLLIHPPSLLVVSSLGKGISLREAKAFPPLLRQAFPGVHRLIIPARLTLCGTVHTLDALRLLALVHDRLVMGGNP